MCNVCGAVHTLVHPLHPLTVVSWNQCYNSSKYNETFCHLCFISEPNVLLLTSSHCNLN